MLIVIQEPTRKKHTDKLVIMFLLKSTPTFSIWCQDVCISLDLSDPTQLPATIIKLLRVVSSLPRLEAFVGEVCEVVLQKGVSYLPREVSPSDPSAIPSVLQIWLNHLGKRKKDRETMEMIRKELLKRIDGGTDPLDEPSDLVQGVSNLHLRNVLQDALNLSCVGPAADTFQNT